MCATDIADMTNWNSTKMADIADSDAKPMADTITKMSNHISKVIFLNFALIT